MSREDTTGEIPLDDTRDQAPSAGPDEPVGRVNMVAEPEQVAEGEILAAPAAPRDEMMQKVIFGVIAIVAMILAMIVMLQGVFEQKMPV